MSLHTTADDPTKYRAEEEVKAWEERDPLRRLQQYLTAQDILAEQHIEELEAEISERVAQAWEDAQDRMARLGDALAMFDHVYAERPVYLEEQRQACAQFLASHKETDHAQTDHD